MSTLSIEIVRTRQSPPLGFMGLNDTDGAFLPAATIVGMVRRPSTKTSFFGTSREHRVQWLVLLYKITASCSGCPYCHQLSQIAASAKQMQSKPAEGIEDPNTAMLYTHSGSQIWRALLSVICGLECSQHTECLFCGSAGKVWEKILDISLLPVTLPLAICSAAA